jgi:hypothetical protein
VPAFLAERGKPYATRMARFGINLASSGGKRPPTLAQRSHRLAAARLVQDHAREQALRDPGRGLLRVARRARQKAAIFLLAQGRQARHVSRAVNSAVNKVSEKNIDAIERAA